LTDDDIPIPIAHVCKPERLAMDITGLELHDLASNIPVYVPNDTHDVITEMSRKHRVLSLCCIAD